LLEQVRRKAWDLIVYAQRADETVLDAAVGAGYAPEDFVFVDGGDTAFVDVRSVERVPGATMFKTGFDTNEHFRALAQAHRRASRSKEDQVEVQTDAAAAQDAVADHRIGVEGFVDVESHLYAGLTYDDGGSYIDTMHLMNDGSESQTNGLARACFRNSLTRRGKMYPHCPPALGPIWEEG
jgi:hypothetical protein